MRIELPRSVIVALWLERLRAEGPVLLPAALAAIRGEDEPHQTDSGGDFGLLLSDLAGGDLSHAALPVPGEPGVPAAVAAEALEAEEAVLVRTTTGTTAAIPHVHTFGSAWEPGAQVTWKLHHDSAVVPLPASLSEARHDLAQALELAIQTLTQIDVARWREEDAEEIAQLASSEVPVAIAQALPPGIPRRVQDLLVRSARLLAIVDLAVVDDGAAVNLWQADQRGTAMRHVATTARRAIASATVSAPQDSTSR